MLITYFLFLQVIFSSLSFAFDESRITPRAVSLAYTGAARIALNETTTLNPSASAFSRVYSVESGMNFYNRNTFFISISDNKNSKNGGGGAIYARNDDFWQLNFVLNRLFLKNRLSLGIGLDFKKFSEIYNKDKLFAPSFGAIYLLTESIVIGAYAKHLLEDDYGIFPRYFSLGLRWSFLDFASISLDTVLRGQDFILSSALESFFQWGGGLTLGLANNLNTKHLTYTMGVGFYAPKISLYYSLLVEEITQEYEQFHGASLRIFF